MTAAPRFIAALAVLVACSPRDATPVGEVPPNTPEPPEATGAPEPVADTSSEEPAPPPETDPPAAEEPPPPADPYGPVSEEVSARFAGIQPDPKPTELTRNSHYWVSNERSQFLWYPTIRDLGGAYIGVGTDQNYMLAGWAKSDFLVLMDFDAAIVNLHEVYRAIFAKAETPEQFMELWKEDSIPQVRTLLEEAHPDEAERKPIVRAHKIARKLVWSRLRRLQRQYPPLSIPTFVTDQEQYDHVRKLWANGRVVAVRGDLTANQTMVGIADALRDSNMELGILYMSNAEQYFEYTPQFRRNIIKLPFAENAQILRTLGWEVHGFVAGEEYHYNTQAGRSFVDWMTKNRVSKLGRLLRKKTATDVPGSSVLDKEPEVSKKPPEIAD